MSEARDLLRRLAAHDERSLQATMASALASERGCAKAEPGLDRRTRLLVRLAALIAIGACTESLRWAVDLASTGGADDEALAAVLVATGCATGSAQIAASAPRMALAMGSELWPGSRADRLLTEEARVGRARDRLRPRSGTELAVHRMSLGLHSVGGDAQLRCDLPERSMARHEPEDPQLGNRER